MPRHSHVVFAIASLLLCACLRPPQEPSWDAVAYGLIKEGRCAEAQGFLRGRNDVDNPYWYTCLADAIAACGLAAPSDTQVTEAMQVLESGLARLHDSPRIRLKMAMIQANAGHIAQAKTLAGKALLAARHTAGAARSPEQQQDDRLVVEEAEVVLKALEPKGP